MITEADLPNESAPSVLLDSDLVQVVMEFLETIFHTLLYVNQIYPKRFFRRFKTAYLHQQVFVCESKLVRSYLNELVLSMRTFLEEGSLDSIHFLVLNGSREQNDIIREYMFQFKYKNREAASSSEKKEPPAMTDEEFTQLYLQMRNFYLQLHNQTWNEEDNNEQPTRTFLVRVACRQVPVAHLKNKLDWFVVSKEDEDLGKTIVQDKDSNPRPSVGSSSPSSPLLGVSGSSSSSSTRSNPAVMKLAPIQRFSSKSLNMQLLCKEPNRIQ